MTDDSENKANKATVGAMYISALALVVSAGALVVSGYSAHLTGQQNKNAQQQELVSLVTDIEQGQQAATQPNGASAALILLGEAEEASNIITSLPPSDVSSAEKYIVGKALESGDDYRPALTLLTSAAKERSDPRTTADAWRAAAATLYILNMNSQAEEDITQAKKAYSGKDVTSFSQENNIAFTDLFDVQYQASISDCSFAENQEWDTAAQLIQDYHQHYHRDLLSGPNAEQEATNARKALLSTCRVPPGTLKANNILTLISP